MNIAVFASGRGSNFSAILKAIKKGVIKADLSLLICDNPKAAVLTAAARAGIKSALVKRQDFTHKEEFENRIIQCLEEEKIDLIVLAGFMRILSPEFVQKYKGRILNIHPALLPSFKGAHAIKDAYEYGVKLTGVTVHFVDEEMDHGPIILQVPLRIKENDTLESIERKLHKIEHKIYPQAIKLWTEGKLKLSQRVVMLKDILS
ncbi:MAG: phosphoribosylglycinamide formyltransferase [Candidatus Omnitrophota bacterium]